MFEINVTIYNRREKRVNIFTLSILQVPGYHHFSANARIEGRSSRILRGIPEDINPLYLREDGYYTVLSINGEYYPVLKSDRTRINEWKEEISSRCSKLEEEFRVEEKVRLRNEWDTSSDEEKTRRKVIVAQTGNLDYAPEYIKSWVPN